MQVAYIRLFSAFVFVCASDYMCFCHLLDAAIVGTGVLDGPKHTICNCRMFQNCGNKLKRAIVGTGVLDSPCVSTIPPSRQACHLPLHKGGLVVEN